MTLRLGIVACDGRQFEHEAGGDAVVVGRSSRANLTLADRSISREHARFFRRGQDWFVEDLGSHNGTFVNGAKVIDPYRLTPGDSVRVGDSTLVAISVSRPLPELEHSSDSVVYRPARDLLAAPDPRTQVLVEGSDVNLRLVERLSLLIEVHHALARSISQDELLELILDRAFAHFRPQEAAIFLRGPDGRDVCAARRSTRGPEVRPLHSQSLLHEVIDKGMAASVVDTSQDQRFAGAGSLVASGVRTLMAAPLLDPQGVLGMIVLAAPAGARAYRPEDLELLVSLASVAAMRIRNVRLVAEALEHQRLEEELRLARTIQVALLPGSAPTVAGYEIHGGNVPSRGVSGDFFEFSMRSEGRECALVVADVSGKGVAAALLTASLEALLSFPLESGQQPDAVCSVVSALLYQRTPREKYATAFVAVLETETGRLRYVNAGHNPPLLVRTEGEPVLLKSNGLPIGLFPTARYACGEVNLAPGDLLFVYTDGITEATNRGDEEYGLPRLLEFSRRHRDLSARDFAGAVEQDVDQFVQGEPYADDRTFVVVKRLRPGS